MCTHINYNWERERWREGDREEQRILLKRSRVTPKVHFVLGMSAAQTGSNVVVDSRLRLWLDWSCGRGPSRRGYYGLGGVWWTWGSDIPRLWGCAQLRRSGGGHTSWDGPDSTAFSQPHYWGSQPPYHSNLHTGQRVNSSPLVREDRERWWEKRVYDYRQDASTAMNLNLMDGFKFFFTRISNSNVYLYS